MQQHSMSPALTSSQILQTFQKYGYPAQSMISRPKMTEIMNEQYRIKTNININPDLIQQIWNESEATSKGEISISTIAQIVVQAQQILAHRIAQLAGQGGMIETLANNIRDKEVEVKEYMEFYSDDRQRNNQLTKELINMQIQQKQNQHDIRAFREDYETLQTVFGQNHGGLRYQQVDTQYLSPGSRENSIQNYNSSTVNAYHQSNLNPIIAQPLQHSNPRSYQGQQKSKRLAILFYLTCALTLMQFLIMSSFRVSMLPLTFCLHSFYVLLFGVKVYDNCLTYLLVHASLCEIMDIIFLVLKLTNKYELMPIIDSNLEHVIMTVVFVLNIAGRIAYIVLLVMLIKSIGNDNKKNYYFTIMGVKLPNSLHNLNSNQQPHHINMQNQQIISAAQPQPPLTGVIPGHPNYLEGLSQVEQSKAMMQNGGYGNVIPTHIF